MHPRGVSMILYITQACIPQRAVHRRITHRASHGHMHPMDTAGSMSTSPSSHPHVMCQGGTLLRMGDDPRARCTPMQRRTRVHPCMGNVPKARSNVVARAFPCKMIPMQSRLRLHPCIVMHGSRAPLPLPPGCSWAPTHRVSFF